MDSSFLPKNRNCGQHSCPVITAAVLCMVQCMPTLSGKEGVLCDSELGFKEGRGGSNLGRKPGSMRLATR